MTREDLRRVRMLVALAQFLSLGALTAAVSPVFTALPASLASSLAAVAFSLALAFTLGRGPAAARTPRHNQGRALLAVAVWVAVAAVLIRYRLAPSAQAVVWAAAGFVVFIQGLGTAQIDGEDAARALTLRAAIGAGAAVIAAAFTAPGAFPASSAVALGGLGAAAVANAVGRALVRGVDTRRVGQSAAIGVGVVAALAAILSLGPVTRALGFVLGTALAGVGFALAIIAAPFAYAFYWLLSRLHPHWNRLHIAQPVRVTTKHQGGAAHVGHSLPMHDVGALLAAVGVIVALVLIGRARRPEPVREDETFRDEILAPKALRLRRPGRRRPDPPPPGLRRTYAEALGILAAAAEGAVHPDAADTPRTIEGRVRRVLGPDGETFALFSRLSRAYAHFRYGGGPDDPPDAPARLLSGLRAALPPPRRQRGGRRRT